MLRFVPKNAIRWDVNGSIQTRSVAESQAALHELEISMWRAAVVSILICVFVGGIARWLIPTMPFPWIEGIVLFPLIPVVIALGVRVVPWVSANPCLKWITADQQKRWVALTENHVIYSQHGRMAWREYMAYRILEPRVDARLVELVKKNGSSVYLPLPQNNLQVPALNLVQSRLPVWKYDKSPEDMRLVLENLDPPFDILFYAASIFWPLLWAWIGNDLIINQGWNPLLIFGSFYVIGPGLVWQNYAFTQLNWINLKDRFSLWLTFTIMTNMLSGGLGIIFMILIAIRYYI